MRLHELIKTPGRKSRKRIGRGEGSGRGKTSGRGHKGQRARSGSSLRPGFESGHVPLYRKLPKRGFNNARFRTSFAVVNVGDLRRIEGGTVDREALVQARLVRKDADSIKILGDGDLDRALNVTVDRVSGSAREKIEKAGGTVTVLKGSRKTASAESGES